VLSTGDEVVPWTGAPLPHQVRDANRLGVAARLESLGAEIVREGHAPDDPAVLRGALAAALSRARLVVTIGGVSMGEKDLLPAAFAALGVRELLHGVALQPGKPVWIGHTPAAWVVGLPGNPLSSFVVAELFLRPLHAWLAGSAAGLLPAPLLPAIATAEARSRGRELWMPACVEPQPDGPPRLHPARWAGSADWSVLAGANALLRLPPQTAVAAGDPVRYLPLA
jgi:molybdopterin molybdotransferase